MKDFFKEGLSKIKNIFEKDDKKSSSKEKMKNTAVEYLLKQELMRNKQEENNDHHELNLSKELKNLLKLSSSGYNKKYAKKCLKLLVDNHKNHDKSVLFMDNKYYDLNSDIFEIRNRKSSDLVDNSKNIEILNSNKIDDKACIGKENDNDNFEVEINPVILIAGIGFHHTKGSIVEYFQPSETEIIENNKNLFNYIYYNDSSQKNYKKVIEELLNCSTYMCLPDSIHLYDKDHQFFIINKYNKLIFGVSCYRQFKTNSKLIDNENSRDCVQKSICILSPYPLFGNLFYKLDLTISAYFNQNSLMDKDIIKELFDNIRNISLKNININEINMSFSLIKLMSIARKKVSINSN